MLFSKRRVGQFCLLMSVVSRLAKNLSTTCEVNCLDCEIYLYISICMHVSFL